RNHDLVLVGGMILSFLLAPGDRRGHVEVRRFALAEKRQRQRVHKSTERTHYRRHLDKQPAVVVRGREKNLATSHSALLAWRKKKIPIRARHGYCIWVLTCARVEIFFALQQQQNLAFSVVSNFQQNDRVRGLSLGIPMTAPICCHFASALSSSFG